MAFELLSSSPFADAGRHSKGEREVAPIPPAVSYVAEHKALARFAFYKTDPVLEEAAKRLCS